MSRLIRDVMYNGHPLLLFTGQDILQEVVATSLDDLWAFTSTDVGYSFRGQSDSTWPLRTSFERFVLSKTCRIAKENIEQEILRRYRSEFSVFSVSADTPVPPFSDLSFPPEAVGVVVDAQQCVA